MGLFHRKSRWERLVDPVTSSNGARAVAKSGLAAVGTFVGVTVASAVVSTFRRHGEQS